MVMANHVPSYQSERRCKKDVLSQLRIDGEVQELPRQCKKLAAVLRVSSLSIPENCPMLEFIPSHKGELVRIARILLRGQQRPRNFPRQLEETVPPSELEC